MKKQLFAMSLVAGLATLAGVTPVFAQDWDAGLKVNVPFAFTVGHRSLPAGAYTIRRVSGVTTDVYGIFGQSREGAALFEASETVSSSGPMKHDEVMFSKVGDRYFLSKIDAGAEGSELFLAQPKSEKRLLASAATVSILAAPSGE